MANLYRTETTKGWYFMLLAKFKYFIENEERAIDHYTLEYIEEDDIVEIRVFAKSGSKQIMLLHFDEPPKRLIEFLQSKTRK